jgi:predicted regulator of Ras-like GTPase activity (Roadblock/LC7/MglB family)
MALYGSLTEMSVADLIQHNCQEGKTGQLTVDSAGKRALIYFRSGALVHAALGMTSGEEVVYEALGWTEGKFILEIGTASPAVTIQRSWSTLLLEGAQRVDEARNATPVDPVAIRRDGMVGEIMRAYLASSRLFRSALIVDAAGIVRSAFLENPSEQDTLSAIGAAVISFSRRSLRVANQGKPLYSILQGENGCTVIWGVNPSTFLVVTSSARINPINALEELNKVSANLNEFL